jgi:hypothetical protein
MVGIDPKYINWHQPIAGDGGELGKLQASVQQLMQQQNIY